MSARFPGVRSYAAGPFQNSEFAFHYVVPLGVESLQFSKSKQLLNLMASAYSPEFEDFRRVESSARSLLVQKAKQKDSYYPSQITFRVSALTGESAFEDDPLPLARPADVNDYLTHLQFRLKVFSGLSYFYLQPVSVEMIGMPAEVPYDERIYLADFKLNGVPASDRIVLEVLDPNGTRVSRFHLELE